ncbi:MAG: hypothetical protein HOE11_00960 [Candidatus Diapherotrites archaeon]|jgi:hypothetical protein|nr:hypothetical protein [Candidatus Diapherotrites archaeon]MBT4596541.1 hypothetical protein [Candidatus Diapherotrites archaeon]
MPVNHLNRLREALNASLLESHRTPRGVFSGKLSEIDLSKMKTFKQLQDAFTEMHAPERMQNVALRNLVTFERTLKKMIADGKSGEEIDRYSRQAAQLFHETILNLTAHKSGEQFKPGRFKAYYDHGGNTQIPMVFLSEESERAAHSSPGLMAGWYKFSKTKPSDHSKEVPQLALIPKEGIGRFLKFKLYKQINTRAKRREIDALSTSQVGKRIKSQAIRLARAELAAIDWAEQTYGIQIDISKEILDWIGHV